MLLSVAMIVKNEEKNLERCLSALKKLDGKIDYEIIVVDTGSNDSTVEIIKRYTDKVYEYKWNDNFSEMRNISIEYCTGEWILILDADEVIEDEKSIIDFLKRKDLKYINSAKVKFKNVTSSNDEKYVLCDIVRLFRAREEFFYTGAIHEQPRIIEPTVSTNIIVKHYGYYSNDYKLMEYKFLRNEDILLNELEKENNKDKRIYIYFQLAQTYAMAKKYNKVNNFIFKAYELVKVSESEKEYLYIHNFFAMNRLLVGDLKTAIEVAERALEYSEIDIDFYYILFKAYSSLNNYILGNIYYKKYMKLHKEIENGKEIKSFVNINSYYSKDEVLTNKIAIEFENKNTTEVINLFNEIKDVNIKKNIEEIYLYSLFIEKKYIDFKLYLKGSNIDDEVIQKVANLIKILEKNRETITINKGKLLGIDNQIDKYINFKYNNFKYDAKIEFKKFYEWKGEIFKSIILKDINIINELIRLNEDDKEKYINYCIKDYICIGKLIEYTKLKFQNNTLEEVLLVSHIEKRLLLNNFIEISEYNYILNRAIVNSNYIINRKYNKDMLSINYSKKILTEYEYIMLEIKSLFKIISIDKKSYIHKLRELLDSNPYYNNIFKCLLKCISDTIVSNQMIVEKNNLVVLIEDTISRGGLEEAESILNELESIFKYDEQLMILRGILEYFKGEMDTAIETLSLGTVIYSDSLDMIYNLATVLEHKGYYNNAKLAYEKAKDKTNIIEYKNNIEKAISELENKI